jgi:hypothetical protein
MELRCAPAKDSGREAKGSCPEVVIATFPGVFNVPHPPHVPSKAVLLERDFGRAWARLDDGVEMGEVTITEATVLAAASKYPSSR